MLGVLVLLLLLLLLTMLSSLHPYLLWCRQEAPVWWCYSCGCYGSGFLSGGP